LRVPGGASCLAACMTWVANSASVPLDSLDFPSLSGPLHRGQLTTFFPCEMDITVNDILQAGQLMIFFSCRARRSFTCLKLSMLFETMISPSDRVSPIVACC